MSIKIPNTLNLQNDSFIWDLLRSKEFVKLRCGREKELRGTELQFLEQGFRAIGCSIEGKEDEKMPRLMVFKKASYELTKAIMNS